MYFKQAVLFKTLIHKSLKKKNINYFVIFFYKISILVCICIQLIYYGYTIHKPYL